LSIKIIKNDSISIDSPYKILSNKSYLLESSITSISENNFEEDRVADALAKESEILINANIEADRILNEAKTKASSIFDAKIQEGFEDGYSQGLINAEKKMEIKLKELEKMKDDAKNEYKELMKSAEPNIVRLVMNISRKFLKNKLDSDKEIIVNMTRDTILKFTDAAELTVKVSSQDYGYVLDKKLEIMSEIYGLHTLEIVNDDNLPQGSCLVESKDNSIDASIDKRIDKIEKAFGELLNYTKQ
jgi:flagellar assembly protein FliH